MLSSVLEKFGLNTGDYRIQKLSSGLINKTWKITALFKSFILQEINNYVFKRPEHIDNNLQLLKTYLSTHYPDYLFVAPIASRYGSTLIQIDGRHFRLFEFVNGSRTINSVKTCNEAYEAARQFGKFSRLLSDFNANGLVDTLPDFHNLSLRFDQFIESYSNSSREKLAIAKDAIGFIIGNEDIVRTYEEIKANKTIPRRVIHHDTKISNVLFNEEKLGLCVIDLDTVMSGLYISDVGDMMRTYLCPVDEEETDLSKIEIRTDFFQAVYTGYISEMGSVLSEAEKQLFIYSGEFVIYMQAVRFLTDYLNNDIYYGAKHPAHNLNRALNQITLLNQYQRRKKELQEAMLINS